MGYTNNETSYDKIQVRVKSLLKIQIVQITVVYTMNSKEAMHLYIL
jgi:hypothetical protein